MKKKVNVNTILEYLIGICFLMSFFPNVVSFYFTGNTNDLIRKIISWGMTCLIAVILGVYIIYRFLHSSKYEKKSIIWSFLPCIIGEGVLGILLIKSKGDYLFVQQIASYTMNCVPLVCGIIYGILEKRMKEIILKFKYLVLVVIPFYILALLHLVSENAGYNPAFAGLTYLSIGNTALIIFVFLIGNLLWYYRDQEKKIGLLVLICAELVFTIIELIISGSRNAVLSWIVSMIFMVTYLFIRKMWKPMIGVCLACILAACSSLLLFNKDTAAFVRYKDFIHLMQDDNYNDVSYKDTMNNIERLYNSTAKLESGDLNEDFDEDTKEDIKDMALRIINGNGNGISRVYLWNLAFHIIQKKPLSGLGVGGYWLKIGTYPHNILLEIAVDFGVPVCIGVFSLLLLLIIYIIKLSLKDWNYVCLLFYFAAAGIFSMFSGTVYNCAVLTSVFSVSALELCKQKSERRIC